jgi:hypothetical protein
MNSEEFDFKFAQKARANSTDFKRLCLLSLAYQAKTINTETLLDCINEGLHPPERRSPSFSRKVKG